jgi:hypothetical protein
MGSIGPVHWMMQKIPVGGSYLDLGLTHEASMDLVALEPLLLPSFPSQRRELAFCFPFPWGKKDKGKKNMK